MQTWNYIIGDIHGCFEEFQQLEELIAEHASRNNVKPYIISVGDLIDRGPDSFKVVKHFYDGTQNKTHLAIMGNHEQLFLEMLEHFAPDNFSTKDSHYPQYLPNYLNAFESKDGMARYLSWEEYPIFRKCFMLGQGAFQTLESFNCDPHNSDSWRLPDDIISYLVNLPYFYESKDFIVTHALAQREDLLFIKQLATQDSLNLEQIELWRKMSDSLIWNRTPPEEPPDPKKWHISGHTPVKKAKRYSHLKCLQIDTGCVYGGRLIAYCVEAKSYISVNALKKYF